MIGQAPRSVVLVRPHHFRPNPQTAIDNAFQHDLFAPADEIARRALAEVDSLAAALRDAGVEVTVFDDLGTSTPDSVFPNNWLSTHGDGTLALYPMYAANRRAERRPDIVAHLQERFEVQRMVDRSAAELGGRFLEGTGAMVLDHADGLAYACRSRRLDPGLFAETCADLGLRPVLFDASDAHGVPVYHTNVLMSIGAEIALVGAEMIRDAGQRAGVLRALRESGREIVELSEQQIRGFAGNCLEVQGGDGRRYLVMSARAAQQLTPVQRRRIERSCRILTAPVPTIEAAGGSVRCMIAGIHLPQRQAESSTGIPNTRTTVVPAAV